MKVETTFVFGRLSALAAARLPVWTHSFVSRIIDRFPPLDAGGLPPGFHIIDDDGMPADRRQRRGVEP